MVELNINRPDSCVNPHIISITPAIVSKVIISAIDDGWEPKGKGAPYIYRYDIEKNS